MNDKRRLALVILSTLGVVDSIYLTVLKLTGNKAMCIQGVGDCFTVNNSPWSEWNGIPIAVIGALGYLAILALLLLERRSDFFSQYSPLAVFGMSLVGVLYSIYLTVVEVFILREICPFCVISALLMLSIFIIAIVRLVKGQQPTPD